MAVLYVTATPIGNLNDFSPRGIETLKTADLIIADINTIVPVEAAVRYHNIPRHRSSPDVILVKIVPHCLFSPSFCFSLLATINPESVIIIVAAILLIIFPVKVIPFSPSITIIIIVLICPGILIPAASGAAAVITVVSVTVTAIME